MVRRRAHAVVEESTAAGEPNDLPLETENIVDDDRNQIVPGDRVLLIIEDDIRFARILMDMGHERSFKVLVANRGDAGLVLARQYSPSAITLDLDLPALDGWAVLDRLKHHPATRHIPVHIISVTEERQRGLRMGALAYINKPVTKDALQDAFTRIEKFVARGVRNLLLIEDDHAQRNAVMELIGDKDVQITSAATGQEALQQMEQHTFDCVVLDLGLPDINGFDLVQQIKSKGGEVPIIIYTGRDLTPKQETELRRLAETIIIKDVRSLDRLLDETALFLHRVEEDLPEPKRQMLQQLHQTDPVLAGRKVLIIDDDMRNIFALTSLLERYQMKVIYAENGRDGIETLKNTPDVDVALVDIMMPEMDGYEAMRQVRELPEFKNLPMIALTAKAMKGDRDKCIDAGASDYIIKPADSEQLLSLLRVWLFK
jgi:CheY-like chemotaxis protein